MGNYLIEPSVEGIFALAKDKCLKVSSVKVAEMLGIEHKNLLRIIDKIFEGNSGWSEDFRSAHICADRYKDSQGKRQRCFNLTRDGFMAVVKMCQTKNANAIMEIYINAFNKMEDILQSVFERKISFPKMTDAIQRNFSQEEIKEKYIYSRECNLIYIIVFGHNAQWLRKKFNLEVGQNVLSAIKDKTAIENCSWLESTNATLMDLGMLDYNERKDKLTSMLIRKLGHELEEYRLESELDTVA